MIFYITQTRSIPPTISNAYIEPIIPSATAPAMSLWQSMGKTPVIPQVATSQAVTLNATTQSEYSVDLDADPDDDGLWIEFYTDIPSTSPDFQTAVTDNH